MTTVVAIEMGYGHLRAAAPLAQQLNGPLLHADRAPLADEAEQQRWAKARRGYERLSRLSQLSLVGRPLEAMLNGITHIPHLHPYRDLSSPTLGTRYLARAIRGGLGRGLSDYLKQRSEPLLTTFYAPAIAADHYGCDDLFCVVTDSDVNRIWAPMEPERTRIQYLVPSPRAFRRLRSYGVPPKQIEFTGFPLPDELLGGPELTTLKKNLARRLVRLDPDESFRSIYRAELEHFLGPLPVKEEQGRPPLITFAVGGAGAQVEIGRSLLASLKTLLVEGRMRLALVAGIRREVAMSLEEAVREEGLSLGAGEGGSGGDSGTAAVQVLYEPDLESYFARFNALLAETDVLWTKPSEMTFFGALGLPLVLSKPMGVHESFNRRWARESGAGLKQRDARYAAGWLGEWLTDGTLAGAAWGGFMRLPKHGTYRILEAVEKRKAGSRE